MIDLDRLEALARAVNAAEVERQAALAAYVSRVSPERHSRFRDAVAIQNLLKDDLHAAVLPATILELVAEVRRLRVLIREAQWVGRTWGDIPTCPWCGGFEPGARATDPRGHVGHTDACPARAALGPEEQP